MSDPIRLLSGGGYASMRLDQRLLASARDDRAPMDAEERVLAALGVGVAGVAVAVSAASAPSLSAGGGGGASMAGTATTATTTGGAFAPAGIQAGVQAGVQAAVKVTGVALAKWIGIAAVALAAAAGTYEAVATRRQPRADAMRTPVASPAFSNAGERTRSNGGGAAAARGTDPETETEAARTDVAAQLPPPEQVLDTTRDEQRPIALPAPPSSVVRVAPKTGELAGELSLLDQARGALARRDPSAATASLDEYARKYPNGTMREEATVARIESLLLGGQSALAATQAEQFLREHPASTNTKRVRQLKRRATAE